MPDFPFLLSKLATASCPNNNLNADPFLIPSSSSEGCSAPSSSVAGSSPSSTCVNKKNHVFLENSPILRETFS
ncbi:hypothetical protein HN873_067181 [Arachis hypogaea]